MVNRLRIASGEQIQRVCFADLGEGRSRVVSRSRVVARLVSWRVLMPLERRIGGAERGSSAGVYALDTAGARLLARSQLADGERVRVRRPGTPVERTMRHMLAVSELYVRLVETARRDGFGLREFKSEPGCYWPNGVGGLVKPDAYVRLVRDQVEDHWWIEHDEATESLPTVRRKLEAYLSFWNRGQLGPGGVMPRVLVSAVTAARAKAINATLPRGPEAEKIFAVVESQRAAEHMEEILLE
ncbi:MULTISPECIES: replication-relaxation family protein [Streptacidiphilus]|uniref:Replication-relaxation family protein n=1 Tax=Streptacidiphilus cavernicola TaxID=3342716 RepID=A0ABV6ULV3_9ACTN|nr:replication-relaxation family protein [Streptacidiphilus jeojiense]